MFYFLPSLLSNDYVLYVEQRFISLVTVSEDQETRDVIRVIRVIRVG